MPRRRLAKSAKVRVLIDGICLQTTAGNLDTGAISISLANAWREFQDEYKAGKCIGVGRRIRDNFLGRDVDIQFDIY